MAKTVLQFSTSGLGQVIKDVDQLAASQRQLEKFLRDASKAFESQGQSSKTASQSARDFAAANNITADSFKALIARQKEVALGADAINTAVKKTISVQKEAAAAAADQAAQLLKVAKANAELGNSFRGNQAAVQALTTAFKGDAVAANEAVNAFNKLKVSGAELTNIQKQLATQLGVTKSQFDELNKVSNESGKTQINGGKDQALQQTAAATGAAVAVLGAGLAKGAGDFIKYEDAIKKVGITSETFGTDKLVAFEKNVQKLGQTTAKNAQEIAEASVELVRAGFSLDEVTTSLPSLINGSVATGESLKSVADIAAKVKAQFGLTANDIPKIIDGLVGAANAGNVSVSSLGESLKFAGVAAKDGGQSFEDTVTFLTLLGDAGLQGGQGGRNFASALTRLKIASADADPEILSLVKGSAKMREAFDLLNISLRDTTTKELKPLSQAIPALKSQLNGFDRGEKDIILKSLFGEEGGRAINAVLGRTQADIDKVSKGAKNLGIAAKSGQQALSGLSGASVQLDSSLATLSIRTGELQSGALAPLATAAKDLINGFLAAPPAVQQFVFATTLLSGAIAAAIAVTATYQLLKIGEAAATVASTAATILSTTATNAATAAKFLFNTQITLTNANLVKENAFKAIATITNQAFTASTLTSAGALGALNFALLSVLAPLALLGAGVAIVGIVKTTEALQAQNEALEALTANTNITSDVGLNAQQRLKASIDAVNAAKVKGLALTDEELKKAKESLANADKSLTLLKQQLEDAQKTPEAKKGLFDSGEADAQNKARQANIDLIKTQIEAIERQKVALGEAIDPIVKETDATNKGTDSKKKAKEALKDEAQEIKRTSDEIKASEKVRNDAAETATKRRLEDEKTERASANEKEIDGLNEQKETAVDNKKAEQEKEVGTIQQANEKEIQKAKLAFETATLNPLKLANAKAETGVTRSFNAQENITKKANEAAIRSENKTFNDGQNKDKRDFNRTLNKEQKDFDRARNQEQKAFDIETGRLQKDVDRQLQLTDPDTSAEDKAKLEKEFAKEDERAKRREALEAPIRARQEAFDLARENRQNEFEAAKQTRTEEFEAKQNAAKEAFETEVIAPLKLKQEEDLQAAKLLFEETVLAPLRAKQKAAEDAVALAFEETILAPLRIRLEDALNEKKKANEAVLKGIREKFENDIEAKKRAFAEREKTIDRTEEDAKNLRTEAFNKRQREADIATAERIEAIKKNSKTDTTDKPPEVNREKIEGRRYGGSVNAGTPYQVFDDGKSTPEVFIPKVSGTILTQMQAKQNLEALLSVTQPKYQMVNASTATAISDSQSLLKETKALRESIENKKSDFNVPVTFIADDSGYRNFDQYLKLQMASIRSML